MQYSQIIEPVTKESRGVLALTALALVILLVIEILQYRGNLLEQLNQKPVYFATCRVCLIAGSDPDPGHVLCKRPASLYLFPILGLQMPAQVRAFFISLFQVILLTAAMIALIFMAIGPDPDHYFAGSLLQLDLLKNTPSPRIILVGGSNVSFGLDAELMQRTLGIPVINDGLHAGLGIVPLRELQEYFRAGDIVIISLEYTMFSSESVMEGDLAFLSDWIEYSPRRIRYPLPSMEEDALPLCHDAAKKSQSEGEHVPIWRFAR